VSKPLADLAAENAALRERIALALAEIEKLRAEAAQRQVEIRALAAQLPERVSRRAVLTSMVSDFRSALTSTLMRRRSA
jgi:chromosome segregation ATPase